MGRVPIVMRSDGSVSAMRLTDLKGIAERDERIRQLEKQCEVLSAEVDRQRLVMDAVTMVLEYQYRVSDPFAWQAIDDLRLALLAYQASNPK